jgi:response regulator RpfG family c-di-GMP phosphodiesterase
MRTPEKTPRILIVDDDASLRQLVARRMRRSGYQVAMCETAEAALVETAAGRAAFDVVITDVHMPAMNGIQLAAILLERRPEQRIIIVTGDPNEAVEQAAQALGPVTFLHKPFALDDVAAAAARAIADAAAVGVVPAEWLSWADERSYAGTGHGERVARAARVIADTMAPAISARSLEDLETAARAHEVGLVERLSASPVDVAWRSAEMLVKCGCSGGAIAAVRHLHERWDGTGGPDRLSGHQIPVVAQLLAAADAIDHYSAAWIHTGMDPLQAVDRAVSLVAAQYDTSFNPDVSHAVSEAKDSLRQICGVQRRSPLPPSVPQPIRPPATEMPARDVTSVMF